jgi:hypothetical protein
MKNILLFFLFVTGLSFSQNGGNITLEWKDNVKSSIGDAVVAIPQFQAKHMDFNPSAKTLRFSMSQPAASAVDPSSLRITNIIYEPIAPDLLGDLSRSAVPAAINAELLSSHARDDWYAIVSLNPIIKEGSIYRRVKSFSYSYAIDNSGLASRDSNTTNTITNSVLATGEWYRFYVEKSGVYKISKDFLRDLGFNVDTDPRNIKIYGNGGRMLPLLNSVDYPMDLAENAIQFIGEGDGTFNDGDYILFYAEGVDNWNDDSDTYNNLYADRSYYFVTSAGGTGKRILPMAQPAGAPSTILTSFDEYRYHEADLINIARLGRKWHGEAFNVDDEQDFGFTFPDVDSPVTVTVSAGAKSVAQSNMTVTANNTAIGTIGFQPATGLNLATEGSVTGTIPLPAGNTITVSLEYNNGGVPGSNAWLDYIELKAKRKLRGNGSQFRFRYNGAGEDMDIVEYQLSNAAGISEVWDITNIYDVTAVVNISAQQNFSFKAILNQKREYITVVPNDYYSPSRETNTKVPNQNLKGTVFKNAQGQFQDVDYIIISPLVLSGPAERLATLHRTQSGLNVKVVTLDNIYQEFSSGKQDIGAIRNFVKYVYDNVSTPEKKIKYLNLFGDASFDYKDRIPNNTNIVPAFHAYGGGIANYSGATTFVSDEFFVMMDSNEGLLHGGAGEPDIAVGRMLVNSVQQANEMVDKVYEYKNAESYGRWRNEYVLIADDIDDEGVDGPFVFTMEGIAQDLAINKPFINVRKVYADSFVQQVSSGGERYPDAKEQIIRSVNYGSLVVNYLGHGGESGIATERIFETSDAQRLTNRFKYPLFITTTCELTKFDNPYLQTAGEFIYWNPAGGAITMITTTRAIFASVAFQFNDSLTSRLYAFGATEYPSMAEAVRRTKVEMGNGEFSRVISFIGDPALKLAVPKPKIILTEINDVPVSASTEVLEALSYVKLSGQVTNEDGSPLNFYNGELAVTVFDKPINRVTLNNDGAVGDHDNNSTTADAPMIIPFATLGETIFRGNATITNGQFDFGFVVPRDIRMPISEGRISFYAKRNAILEDQTGHDSTIKIGGIDENAVADNTGPKVRIYMNDESFVSGGITNASPIFLAFLEDEHGMNTASGIGHDMIAILDGDDTNPFVVNDYYEANVNDHTRGELRFPFANLAKGLHTLTFKAWDVYNNLVTAELTFVVVGDDEMQIEKVLNYPNPFVSYTEFWFTHNRPFEPLDVQVQVFTITGKVVKTINQTIVTDGFLSRDIRWDGRDDFGDRIGKGVYVYKLTVKSSTTNKRAEKYEKLVLL